MAQRTKVEGTKIAQVAKDLNVTSVTIRRYLTEFNIRTATDENGIKVLPPFAMEELLEVRRLKEEGLSNPQVLEMLAERRGVRPSEQVDEIEDKNISDISTETPLPATEAKVNAKTESKTEENDSDLHTHDEATPDSEGDSENADSASGNRAKHSLTCQTCGKIFEHTNSRLRDCLDCYRTKRKERRRGGGEKHKNVIQHPIAAQVANKALQLQNARNGEEEVAMEGTAEPGNGRGIADNLDNRLASVSQAVPAMLRGPVRNYRKAIEETRQVTGSLKRRLERPDLHEGERRWLEQIYAYQLILHQGWRHLSEYKSGGETNKESQE
jgi:DNA-binding transcriptional MerR regulator